MPDIHCPHCNSPLKRTVPGETDGPVLFGPEFEQCGVCGFPVSRKAIQNGEYYEKRNPGPFVGWVTFWVIFGAGILLVYKSCGS